MSQQSNIEWTDATWNPVRGCVKVSPGCANCYAETFAERFRGVPGHPYEQGFDLRLAPDKLTEPFHWKKPRRVFVNSMSDLFQDGVPYEFIFQVFDVMRRAPQHTFQLLTKRAACMLNFAETIFPRYMVKADPNWPRFYSWPLPNVWLGVSVENQHFADERIPLLLQTPAAVRFISAEPLLGSVDLKAYVDAGHETNGPAGWQSEPSLDWVIVGGESGHGARPFDVAWARSIVEQCKAAGVPVFVKQLGAHPTVGDAEFYAWNDDVTCDDLGRVFLKSRKGGDMAEWPEDLRVREFPRASK